MPPCMSTDKVRIPRRDEGIPPYAFVCQSEWVRVGNDPLIAPGYINCVWSAEASGDASLRGWVIFLPSAIPV